MKKQKIIYIADWFNDIEVTLLNNLLDFDITCTLMNKYPQFKKGTYNVMIFPVINIVKFFGFNGPHPFLLYYKNNIFEFLNKKQPDLIICNLWHKISTIQITRYCKKKKIPLILQDEMQRWPKNLFKRTISKTIYSIFGRQIINQSKRILPWTDSSRIFWKNKKEAQNKLITLSPGIDTTLFKKIKIKKNDEKLKIVCVARFVKYKRHIDLLRAIKELNDAHFPITLTLVGKGPIKEKIKKVTNNFGIEKITKFIENVPHDQMNKIYCSHDVLILPSYNEAIGMVVPEAMACGLPAIVSNTSGAQTYIINNKNGLIFKTFDHKDLKNKIILCLDRNKLKTMGINAKNYIKRNFSIKSTRLRFIKIIKEVLNEQKN